MKDEKWHMNKGKCSLVNIPIPWSIWDRIHGIGKNISLIIIVLLVHEWLIFVDGKLLYASPMDPMGWIKKEIP